MTFEELIKDEHCCYFITHHPRRGHAFFNSNGCEFCKCAWYATDGLAFFYRDSIKAVCYHQGNLYDFYFCSEDCYEEALELI